MPFRYWHFRESFNPGMGNDGTNPTIYLNYVHKEIVQSTVEDRILTELFTQLELPVPIGTNMKGQ